MSLLGRKPPAPKPPPAAAKPAEPQPSAQPQAAPAARPSPWRVQALTADYVAEGDLPPIEMPLAGFMNVQTQSTFTLSSVKLLPLALQAVVATETPVEVTLPKASLIALIPLGEAVRAAALQQMPQRTERTALYAGPFMFQAAVRLMGDMPLRNFFNTAVGQFFLASEAEIACLRNDSVYAPPNAPVIVLNRNAVQLYHPQA